MLDAENKLLLTVPPATLGIGYLYGYNWLYKNTIVCRRIKSWLIDWARLEASVPNASPYNKETNTKFVTDFSFMDLFSGSFKTLKATKRMLIYTERTDLWMVLLQDFFDDSREFCTVMGSDHFYSSDYSSKSIIVVKPSNLHYVKNVFFDLIFNDTSHNIEHNQEFRFMWLLREPKECDKISGVFRQLYNHLGLLTLIDTTDKNLPIPEVIVAEYFYSNATEYIILPETVQKFADHVRLTSGDCLLEINEVLNANKCIMCFGVCIDKVITCCCLSAVCKRCFIALTFMAECIKCKSIPSQTDWYYRSMRYVNCSMEYYLYKTLRTNSLSNTLIIMRARNKDLIKNAMDAISYNLKRSNVIVEKITIKNFESLYPKIEKLSKLQKRFVILTSNTLMGFNLDFIKMVIFIQMEADNSEKYFNNQELREICTRCNIASQYLFLKKNF
jgi:hypothetical protein